MYCGQPNSCQHQEQKSTKKIQDKAKQQQQQQQQLGKESVQDNKE